MSMAQEKVVLNGQIEAGGLRDRGYNYKDLLLSRSEYNIQYNSSTPHLLCSMPIL